MLTYAEKTAALVEAGVILVTPVGSLVSFAPLETLIASKIQADESGHLKLTPEQEEIAKAAIDALAAEIGSRDLVDLFHHIVTRET